MRPPDWFQIGAVIPADKSGRVERRVHAKAFGTTVTACGLPAANMQREWDLAFDVQDRGACPDCREAIATWVRTGAGTTTLKRADSAG